VTPKTRAFGIVFIVLSVLSCSSDEATSSSSSELCDARLTHLKECGVLGSDGTMACSNLPTQRCSLGCEVKAACADLVTKYCNLVNYPSTTLSTCVNACGFQPGFICPDGTIVDASLVCDGKSDCSDNSDETTCATFTCDGSLVLSVKFQCDGHSDCTDGTDEKPPACPSFTCADGSGTIPTYRVCDGTSDCIADSSDELNCPPSLYEQLTCK
jgi:hypothetical protein